METIKNMFSHLHWSNQNILVVLQQVDDGDKQIINLFSHILLAEHVWITRLKGLDSSSLPIWSMVNLADCEKIVQKNKHDYHKFLNGITDLDEIVSYKNSKGAEFSNTVRDILTHVALHGQYHRGQINLLLRKNELEPINVDFITFRR